MASVLVVDDEPGIREFLQIMLDREAVSYTHLTLPTNREV